MTTAPTFHVRRRSNGSMDLKGSYDDITVSLGYAIPDGEGKNFRLGTYHATAPRSSLGGVSRPTARAAALAARRALLAAGPHLLELYRRDRALGPAVAQLLGESPLSGSYIADVHLSTSRLVDLLRRAAAGEPEVAAVIAFGGVP